MVERKSSLNKNAVLQALITNIRKAESDPYSDDSVNYSNIADHHATLAKNLGATDFELSNAYLFAIPEEDRQDLFEVYCEKLWHDKDFKSFEELHHWTTDMITLRKKYNLKDPLEPEIKPTKKKESEKTLSEIFAADKYRQSLMELYCERLRNDDSFESLEELKEWAGEMLKIRNKYKLDDPLKIENKRKPIRRRFRPFASN